MQTATIDQIVSYIKCPKQTQFGWNKKNKIDTDQKIFSDIIKSAYLYHSRREKVVPWKNVRTWTERKISSHFDEITRQEHYKLGGSYLVRLSDWYSDYLENYAIPGLINTPLRIYLGQYFTLTGNIDIIGVGKDLKLFDFDNIAGNAAINNYNMTKVYNDFRTHIKAWATWKISGMVPTEYVRIVISARKIKSFRYFIKKPMLEKTEKTLKHVIRGISDNLFYPSFSDHCESCPYKSQCYI